MRPSIVALAASALLSLAPASSIAAWPTGGLQVALPYHINLEGELAHDGTGNVVVLVFNTGHQSFWIMNRVTPDGDYVTGWAPDGLHLYAWHSAPIPAWSGTAAPAHSWRGGAISSSSTCSA